MDRLDAGHDAGRREPAAIGRVEQLDVLDLGHERDARRRRLEGVERGPHRRVADGVDLRRDAAGGRSFDELAQALGLGVPDAAPQLGRERTVRARARCRRGAPRSATRATRRRSTSCQPIRARPCGIVRRGRRRCGGRRRAPCPARRRAATPSRGAAAGRSRTGARRPGTTSRGRGRARARPGRGPRRCRG